MSEQRKGGDKAARDNRSNQKNPNNWRFDKARSAPPRSSPSRRSSGGKGGKRSK